MGAQAQQKLDAPTFWNNHGLNATRDAFKVSRSTLCRWRKSRREGGMSGLHDHSRAPRHRRRRQWPPTLRAEIRRLRNVFQNLGKAKLHGMLHPWCKHRGLACPSVSTIGRLIADTLDKMRFVPTRLTPKGKVKPRGQAPAPIPSQTTLGQRLLRGLPGSLRRVRHGGALYRAHPPLPAHDHRPRQPLCPSCFVLVLCLGDRGIPPRQQARRTLRRIGQTRVSGTHRADIHGQ